ncbi:hypothetical protein GGI25_001417 [Coemansia spiralis]|uniref:Uncharacterized protein n=2 Tax=Coemansia TaxID=4863 RepID=A0A9W8GCP4_9FUNG|nr:hypothetical protein BX070DRAFT_219120 [Coemansia spiralis]KAJ1994760.1 hypothetical protein EDC05_001382 [Coemansia umbellata]KAJ2624538.1 hypothetical protein GGI26_001457 [Coemansia sp. RSA 1358]KAJ2679494.1 hypothetical protein GGI25_001417 [Coemansia spiralis]
MNSNSLWMQNQKMGSKWMPIAAAVAISVATGATLYMTIRYLKADHIRIQRIRQAKQKHRELIAELLECKGILDYMNKESIPRAEALTDKAHEIVEQNKNTEGGDLNETKQKLVPIEHELAGIGEQLLQLMERIDGVTPAHVLNAAGLEPWTELDITLKKDAIKQGLNPVLELAGDIRAIRKGLIRKAEKRAETVAKLKDSIKA